MMRKLTALLAISLVMSTFLVSTSHAQSREKSQLGSRLSIAVLPDTQFYARYADPIVGDRYTPRWGSEPWASQNRWIVANREQYNIAFATHLGDLVDQAEKPGQWQVADKDMQILDDAKFPYSVLMGNHDFGGGDHGGTRYEYTTTFTQERAAKDPSFVASSPSKLSRAHVFSAQGVTMLNLALSWASAGDFAWAQTMINKYPGMPTIITSHQILDVTDDGTTAKDTHFGNDLFEKLIKNNDQVFLTINGHHHGAAQRVVHNGAGHPVVQVLMDYQMDYAGGNGNMGLIEFDLSGGKISGTAFSPWVLVKPKQTLVDLDKALLDSPNAQYSIPFDFHSRFPTLKLVADQPDLTKKLRETIAANYHNPVTPVQPKPRDSLDYPVVAGTLAHWRPDPGYTMPGRYQKLDQPVGYGGAIKDFAGGNDLRRIDPATAASSGQLADVKLSSDHDPRSSNPYSVCFSNTTRDGNRSNWFQTAAGGRLNQTGFENGYTIETFIKLDPAFTSEKNRWMTALGRAGDRGVIDPKARVEKGEPPLALAISNLKEVQWSFMSSSRPADGWADGSAWSGDVDLNKWFHLAVINDPGSKETTLYINGIPMLRSVSGLLGIDRQLDGFWTLGADVRPGGRADNGWFGCVGETRIVEQVLPRQQWLISRPRP